MSILYNDDLLKLKKQIEDETGFVCYEVQPGDQTTFFGCSDGFSAFKELIGTKFNTGTIAFTMDDACKYMYHKKKNQWYLIP